MSIKATHAIGATVLLGSIIAMATRAQALPVFARKYQTSCQTCHIVFPKLNAYGEAFRLRGYRLPGETAEMVKQPPTSLGAPAYKKLWPDAVWPGDLPSYVPLAVNVKLADVNQSLVNDDGSTTTIHNDFQFPQELNIFGAGTLGDHISFLTEVTFAETATGAVDVSLEHAHIGFDSPFGPEDALHVRIGKFAPNVFDGFQEMWIATDAAIDTLFDFNPIGLRGGTGLGASALSPSPIALPPLVQGIEAYGIVAHRALWVAGVANGVGPLPTDTTGRFAGNNSKDVWARFDYKFWGMGLDGDTFGRPVPQKNWQDNSVRVGVFTYHGNASGIPFSATTDAGLAVNIEDAGYLRTGVYASVYIQNLNVFGVYLKGSDTLNTFDGATHTLLTVLGPDYHTWFTQADYVIYPWLQASGRYESLRPGDTTAPTLQFGVVNLSALIRANVKAMVEYQRDLRDADTHSLNALVRFAF
jgi:hypothetical protein